MAEEKETKKVTKKATKATKTSKTSKKVATKVKEVKEDKKVEEKKVEEKKVEEKATEVAPKKVVTEAVAHTGPLGITPRKARLVVDLVRGKTLDQAYGILANTNKAAVEPVTKLLHAAEANATNNFGMDGSLLYVATIYANESFRLKRFEPRAKGSSSPIIKRWCTITVVLKEKKGATK